MFRYFKGAKLLDPLKWGKLPDFWVTLVIAIVLTCIVIGGMAYGLVKLGVQ